MGIETDQNHVLRGFQPSGSADRDLAELATSQDGVVGDDQLLALGFSRRAIEGRLIQARLHRVHPTVYAVGHRGLSLRGRWRGAVMACGPDALLSHRDVGVLRGVLRSSRPLIEVTVATDRAREIEGVQTYVARRLEPQDRSEIDGIPCVSVPLMLLNLAAVQPRRRVERACDECEVQQLFDLRAIEELLERSRGCRGAGRLRSVLDEHAVGTTLTRNDLEELMLALCRSADVPRPAVNDYVQGASGAWYEVDFHWAGHGLIVETDGNTFHSTRSAIERDRRREADLVGVGYRILRVTLVQLEQRPQEVLLMLSAALSR